MKMQVACLVLLALVMTSSAETSPEVKEVINIVVNDLETLIEANIIDGQIDSQNQDKSDLLRGLAMALRGKSDHLEGRQGLRSRGEWEKWVKVGLRIGTAVLEILRDL